MQRQTDRGYYTSRRAELLCEFDEEAECWRLILARRYGGEFARDVLGATRDRFGAECSIWDESMKADGRIGALGC